MRRTPDVEELLDGPLDDPAALIGNLRDLRRVNRWLGGVSLSGGALDALVADIWRGPDDDRIVTMLDVGTGGADIPAALVRRARLGHERRRSGRVRAIALDSRPEILAAALVADPALEDLIASADLTIELGDGRSLPYPDRSIDVVHCSLVVHHLAPEEVVTLVREMVRVARLGIIVNDLIRGRAAYLGAWLLTRVATRNRYTRHDAPMSVRRAYTRPELLAMLAQADLDVVWRGTGLLGHRWALAARARQRTS